LSKITKSIWLFPQEKDFKFEFPAACWSETEIPTFGAARDEFKSPLLAGREFHKIVTRFYFNIRRFDCLTNDIKTAPIPFSGEITKNNGNFTDFR
jgi:hypothetical protein